MKAQHNNALIQFIDNIENADGIWHQGYWRHNKKTNKSEFIQKDKPFRFFVSW